MREGLKEVAKWRMCATSDEHYVLLEGVLRKTGRKRESI